MGAGWSKKCELLVERKTQRRVDRSVGQETLGTVRAVTAREGTDQSIASGNQSAVLVAVGVRDEADDSIGRVRWCEVGIGVACNASGSDAFDQLRR